jgi:hypothetical protein
LFDSRQVCSDGHFGVRVAAADELHRLRASQQPLDTFLAVFHSAYVLEEGLALNASLNSPSASACGRQIGVGIVLVVFVSLVTFMFSFLGTILCAVMIGMMAAASRKWCWQYILLSLLFPAVLLVSLHVSSSKSELTWFENLRLAAVGFVTFWGSYLATRGVFLLEGGNREVAGDTALGNAHLGRSSGEAVPCWHTLDIEELDGVWVQQNGRPACGSGRKVIEVDHGELTMSLIDDDGKKQILAKGELLTLKLGGS